MTLENIDAEILGEFITETLDQLNSLEEKFVELEKNPDDLEIINSIFRPFHSIKGSSAFFDLNAIKDIAHNIENLIDDLRKGNKKVTTAIISSLLQGMDVMKERFYSLQESKYDESLSSAESDYIKHLDQIARGLPEEKDLTSYEAKINKAISDIGKDFISRHPKVKKLIHLFNQFHKDSLGRNDGKTQKPEYSNNVLYMYEGHNLTEYISDFQQFLTNAKMAAPDSDAYQLFSSSLDQLLKLCEEENLDTLIPVLNSLKENFVVIKEGAADLDELLLSTLEDDINELIKNIEQVKPGEAGVQKLGEILVSKGKVTDKDISEAMGKQRKVGEILVEGGKISKDDIENALTEQKEQIIKKPMQEKKKTVFKTMRVEESKIDHFMDFVGELIVSSEVFNYIQKKIESTNLLPLLAKDYKSANLAFNDLSNDLQKSLMEIRKAPIKNTLQKMPRMVRDIAKNLDKNISLEIVGEDTKIDKSILENIENPLIHIVRNAADHGLETTSQRLEAGKPEQGTIKINAHCDKAFFYLDVIDDGKGIDPETLRKKALEKGSISQSKYNSMSDKEALRLIFLPGVSTAKEVTDLSGRGVGMDVVISNLKKSNGSVDVHSELGKGTSIQIKVPLSVTLIVVDGLIVQVGCENFIIPISKIKESIKPKKNDVSTVTQKGEMVNIRQELFPLVRLHRLFNITPKKENPSESVVILVENENGRCCFLVDELVGQQQVVQKDMGEYLKGISTIAGGAIMGNGRVGLILNVDGIMNKFQK